MLNKDANWFKFLVKSLAALNTLEGAIHIIVALIGFWGIYEIGVRDWRLMFPSVENLIFGLFSIFTGYVLGINHKH